jgi:hypothetical protein
MRDYRCSRLRQMAVGEECNEGIRVTSGIFDAGLCARKRRERDGGNRHPNPRVSRSIPYHYYSLISHCATGGPSVLTADCRTKKRPRFPGAFLISLVMGKLCAEQQYPSRLFFGFVRRNGPIEELVGIEVDLEERRPGHNLTGDQRL